MKEYQPFCQVEQQQAMHLKFLVCILSSAFYYHQGISRHLEEYPGRGTAHFHSKSRNWKKQGPKQL